MNTQQIKRISKFMSLVLRHNPDAIGIKLDESGWVDVDTLLSAMAKKGRILTRDQLQHVVDDNDKQRFSFNEDGSRIRAKQGHSVKVELGYEASEPPEFLCHGTPSQYLEVIKREGLKKMKRHHVHMHADQKIANEVGNRRGKSVLLMILARKMHEQGFEFFVTENNVWLTDRVPADFIEFPE